MVHMELKKTLDLVNSKSFSVEIFGLGYVGFPLAVRLAKNGISVHGVDINSERVERLKNNFLMDSEIHLKDEFLKCRNNNMLGISENPKKSDEPKIGIICVPTPIPNENTNSDVFVKSAVESFLKYSKKGDVIILESSIEVGTTENIRKIIENNGFHISENYGLCFCPERVDPANKEWGIENIPRVIYCSDDVTFEIAKIIYKHVNMGNLIRVNHSKVAEVVKSFENAFRLVNISLVNELAILCDKLGINVKEIINAASTKPFGFLAHYPGAGAGGHCIPKDPRFLLESAKKFELGFDTIKNALERNDQMPLYICNSIIRDLEKLKIEKSILVCGLSYKANVEDMRDSASFKIITELQKQNCRVYGFDPFFKDEYLEKYLIENNLKEFDVKIINRLDGEVLNNVNCLCIVQHHEINQNEIQNIYEKSIIPYIYDCQNKLIKKNSSNTILEGLGI